MDVHEELSKLLYSSFPAEFPQTSRSDIIRLWSLELQWFNPNDSFLVLSHLINMNWIIESDDYLHPNSDVFPTPPVLGWKPILRDILDSSKYVKKNTPIQNIPNKVLIKPDIDIPHNSMNESKINEVKTNLLIRYVSKKSGLTNQEVVRRSRRKCKALGPVTLWLCVSLLAREQGLDMEKIIEILEK
jgi:hypothetical protein